MFCKNCGKDLPDESQFCPYCMTKFNTETKIEPQSPEKVKKNGKKLPVIITAAVLCVALIVSAIIVVPKLVKKKEDKGGSPLAGETLDAENAIAQDSQTTAPAEVKIMPENDNALGLMNVKLRNEGVELSDIEKLIVQYFDTDYFRAPYSSLQRYPQVYKDAQINFLCHITKIIESNAEEYTALVEYEAYKNSEGFYWETGDYAVIKGTQSETRIMEGDTLYLYGKYVDVNTYTVDGKSYTVPTVLVNRYSYFSEYDRVRPMYSMEEIRSMAKYIFGDDIKLRYTKYGDVAGSDYDYDLYEGLYYTAELDNQSNANFTKYLFFAGYGGYIIDCKSEYPVERNLTFSADFEHFYLEVFDKSLKVYTLECYDRDLKKIWSREFDQTTSSVIDYTKDHIYLVANGSMYIIDAKTGENAVDPKYVGAKSEVRKLEDGILLVSHKSADAVMKTDLSGNVLWTANLSKDMTEPSAPEDIPVVQLIGGNYVIQYNAVTNGYPDGTYTAVITPDGTVDFDGEAF
ncbi:MAG: zinc-ribbon domain-containing protein [Clostridia bacterium]|nr:zinc-ribbon domain-containing protein [Clostridia bacterium]